MTRKHAKPVVRCAVYTRKSTEEGLEQEFNTLHAQREAAEAYIASQRHEGWVCLADAYDDGGFTGANTERPALQRLLADIQAEKIDVVVVHRVDRLSRSLLDFARMMEIFDAHQVAFAVVAQQFNTATSMGRLILNVLLSFAQFERELIAERTRDKIAAAKRKGKWAGGTPVLGYDLDPQRARLVVNAAEADRVRTIFDLYREHGALLPVVRELRRRGWTNKRWITRGGQLRGGRPFNKTSLHHLLTRVVYHGKLPHKQEVYDGEHPAIVDEEVWQRVQELLHRRHSDARPRQPGTALLGGLVFCTACGKAMAPSYASKKGRQRYRYYLCTQAQKHGRGACLTPSLPAAALERFVVGQIQDLVNDSGRLHDLARAAANAEPASVPHRTINRPAEPEGDHDEVSLEVIRQPGWERLPASVQNEVLHRLVRRIAYDGAAGKVQITFQPHGIQALVEEQP